MITIDGKKMRRKVVNGKEYFYEYKSYYKKFKDNNSEKIKEKINCECGGCYTYFNKSRHFKSIKHRNFLEKQKNEEKNSQNNDTNKE